MQSIFAQKDGVGVVPWIHCYVSQQTQFLRIHWGLTGDSHPCIMTQNHTISRKLFCRHKAGFACVSLVAMVTWDTLRFRSY